MLKNLCIGIDFGTDSVRALLVDAENGQELATSVFEYPRWKQGLYCNPAGNQFRQHPLDYIEGLEFTVKEVLSQYPDSRVMVKALSVDTTGSTPVATNREGTPLALLPGFEENPNAMFILWKDHSAIEEAESINTLSRTWETDYTRYSGGVYSSEWFWAKILHVYKTDPVVAREAYSWIEHCDWIPALLTGKCSLPEVKRSRCAAGHKAMWHKEWGGLPSASFLKKLHPQLADLRDRLYTDTYTADQSAGTLSEYWADRLGLNRSVRIAVGAFDAHVGAVGGGIRPFCLSKVIGTSTCDMLVAPPEKKEKTIRGISGQVDGSIIPGMTGMEAGQSAFGDVYAWFRDLLMWPFQSAGLKLDESEALRSRMLADLTYAAEKIPPGSTAVIAIDWLNGRRTPDANQSLKGALAGLNLGTDAPQIFRALVESTAYGSKRIIERFRSEGVEIREVHAMGGVAKKSPFVMQILADILDMPVKIVRSEQTCALGAAMFAAVCAGIYRNIEEAQKNMGSGMENEFVPIEEHVKIYQKLYEKYLEFGKSVEAL